MRGAILVTGGASGIGRATVEAVIAGGWRAVVLDLPGPNLDTALAALDPALVRCTALDVATRPRSPPRSRRSSATSARSRAW